jgi:hypothetical protein
MGHRRYTFTHSPIKLTGDHARKTLASPDDSSEAQFGHEAKAFNGANCVQKDFGQQNMCLEKWAIAGTLSLTHLLS